MYRTKNSTVRLHLQSAVSNTFQSTVTLNFDLSTPKSEEFISALQRINDVSLAKIRREFFKTLLAMFRMHTQMYRQKNTIHNASAHTTV